MSQQRPYLANDMADDVRDTAMPKPSHCRELMNAQISDRLGDYVADMLRFLGQNLITENRLLKTVSLHVNASTGDIDLELTDEEQISLQHLMVSQQNRDSLYHSRLEASRAQIRSGRALIALGKWDEALTLLQQVEMDLKAMGDSEILQALQRMNFEIAHYLARRQTKEDHVSWSSIPLSLRKPSELVENHWGQPQTIFILSTNGQRWLGRKLLSSEWITGRISELFCSKISPEMLLGELQTTRVTQDGIVAYYRPATEAESMDYLNSTLVADDAEIVFPFAHLTQVHKLEVISPADGWHVDEAMREQLYRGESALRRYTIDALSDLVPEGALLYDPACSTGDFLRTIQQAYPRTRSFGQDLSAEMIKFARTQLDETFVGDAIHSPLARHSVDIGFVRFLNSEVVSTDYAMKLFDAILDRVKPGGLLVVFGHTPVLLDSGFFENRGLECLRKIGNLESGEVFQFYLLRNGSRPDDSRD